MTETLPYAIVADKSKKAQDALARLRAQYSFMDIRKDKTRVSAIICLGGDGYMLHMMHKYMPLDVPLYGMNCGTVGFLLNRFDVDMLAERVARAVKQTLYPLRMYVHTRDGKKFDALAINEVSLHRQTRVAAKIKVVVDHVVRLEEMVCDGVMVATPAGSTAYNLSANGPIIPIGANIMALTPISVFRPRRWHGALLPESATIHFDVLQAEERPVSAVADFTEIRNVMTVEVSQYRRASITLLFDPEHALEERIISEQFLQ